MTPNDLDGYLRVLVSNGVGLAAIKLSTGAEIHVTFNPALPAQLGSTPEPGGWKGPSRLDNPDDLHSDYLGELPK